MRDERIVKPSAKSNKSFNPKNHSSDYQVNYLNYDSFDFKITLIFIRGSIFDAHNERCKT